MAAVRKVTELLRQCLEVEGLVEPQEIVALLADKVGPGYLTKEQRTAMDDTGIAVVR